jgi:hypothetical protein
MEVSMAIAPTPHEINKAVMFISDSLRYPFVHSFYPMSLPDVIVYLDHILRADPLHRQDSYAVYLTDLFGKWIDAGFHSVPLISARCSSVEEVTATASQLNFSLEQVFGTLYYLAYGLLPRNFYLRDLIEKGDDEMAAMCALLRRHGYPNTLDLLEKARTRKGRMALSIETGVPERYLEDLVNRADFTRMGTTAGNMVRNYINSGVTSLEMLVSMPLEDLVDAMTTYLATLGKVPKYGMDLPAAQAQARWIPTIVEH